ncbi:MAG: crotonase/enoyl-CoA hydratase family protein [Deltaproteobacteria bacterium]|nr:crotonase/enoyl-CoA hydratase family protein [Deltaproteobacteria bacterium]
MAISYELKEGVARLRLDDGKANAMNGTLLGELEECLARATSDDAAIVIEGRPGFFSGGLDLKTLPTLDESALISVLKTFGRVMLGIFDFPGPVVAACTGHAIAGGSVLLLACDERIGARGAFRLGLNESQLGLTLPKFVIEMARASIAPAALRRLAVLGDLLDPARALELGLLHELTEPDLVVRRAIERATALAAIPRAAYAGNKRHVHGVMAEFVDREIDGFLTLMASRR